MSTQVRPNARVEQAAIRLLANGCATPTLRVPIDTRQTRQKTGEGVIRAVRTSTSHYLTLTTTNRLSTTGFDQKDLMLMQPNHTSPVDLGDPAH